MIRIVGAVLAVAIGIFTLAWSDTARAADAPVPAENLVIGEDSKSTTVGRRHDEPALQHTDGERRGRWHPAIREQLDRKK